MNNAMSISLVDLYKKKKKPVWLDYPLGQAGRWVLLSRIYREDEIWDSPHYEFVGVKKGYYLNSEDYGKTWVVYDEEVDLEEDEEIPQKIIKDENN